MTDAIDMREYIEKHIKLLTGVLQVLTFHYPDTLLASPTEFVASIKERLLKKAGDLGFLKAEILDIERDIKAYGGSDLPEGFTKALEAFIQLLKERVELREQVREGEETTIINFPKNRLV